MQTETILETVNSSCVNVAANRITSLRHVESRTAAVRAYDNGMVAVAGQEGAADLEKLLARAQADLTVCGVPYPCSLSAETKRVDARKRPIARADFLDTMRALLSRLEQAAPRFLFGNKLKLTERAVSYQNSAGARLEYAGDAFSLELTMKERSSANIMDLAYGFDLDYFAPDTIVEDVKTLSDAYGKSVDLPKERLPVVLSAASVLFMLLSDVIADTYRSGSGRLKGKLGKKLFSDALNVMITAQPAPHRTQCFFDAEGVALSEEGFKLIDKGTFSGLLSTKRSAAQFGIPVSGGAAVGSYDAVPTYGGGHIGVKTTGTLTDMTQRAIYVAVASGGDMTDQGEIGMPVQAAFLVENGRPVGRLPELMLSGNVFDILGSDLIGVSSTSPLRCEHSPQLVAHMNATRQ